ncbi:MAG: AI-2E family transporter, partial [Firmicutes bacterium]|nr:AI-2E family transporter [Bacillota bacterium]
MSEYIRKVLWWAITVTVTYIFWKWCAGYILPFLLAAFLALLLAPLAARFQAWGVSSGLSVMIALAIGLSASLVVVALAVTLLVAELMQLTHALPKDLHLWQLEINHMLHQLGHLQKALGLNAQFFQDQLSSLVTGIHMILRGSIALAVQLPDFALVLFVAWIAAFFILRDQQRLKPYIVAALPPSWRPGLTQLRFDIMQGSLGFLKAQFYLVTLTALTTALGIFFSGMPYAVLIGLLAGSIDMIPFLGPTALLAPWAVVCFLEGHSIDGMKLITVLVAV